MGKIPYTVIGTARHRMWLQSTVKNVIKSNKSINTTKNPNSLSYPVTSQNITLRGKEVVKDQYSNNYQNQTRNNSEYFEEFVGLTRATLDHNLVFENNEIIRLRALVEIGN